ncbi:hypothetical protein FACS189459_6680 [Bacilli bacterium]|nr:hypothetical protein FACS189459_6680 [Bacilli bacterium]
MPFPSFYKATLGILRSKALRKVSFNLSNRKENQQRNRVPFSLFKNNMKKETKKIDFGKIAMKFISHGPNNQED